MKILMVTQGQFGYSAGYYHYCKHLASQGHSIVFLCNDYHQPKLSLPGVESIYVDEPNSIKWRLKFIGKLKEIFKHHTFDLALCSYYKCCAFILPFLKGTPAIMDIRSGDVSKNKLKRGFLNWLITAESRCFDHTVILSESLAEKLHIAPDKSDIIYLGADTLCTSDKDYSELNMIYVGTLFQRDIDKTITGLIDFAKKYPEAKFHYDIIGFGSPEEEKRIRSLCADKHLNGNVVFHGRLNYELLTPYFEKANLGIGFVPMTPYYDCQPSTKLYEYALSGIFSIATNTYENRLTISPENGILCNDTSEDFANALERYYLSNRATIKSATIRESMSHRSWDYIISHTLLPTITKVATLKK